MTEIVYPDADQGVLDRLRATGLFERLQALGAWTTYPGDPVNDEEFLRRVGDAEIVLLGSNLPARVLREAPALRFVSFTGYGAANFVDLRLAAERGIAVGNTPGYGAESVAEHALALALAAAHRIVPGDAVVRRGEWLLPMSTQLAGRTAGILGYGAIGAQAAMLFRAIGMNGFVWTHTRPAVAPAGVRFAPDIASVMAEADLVSLHLALTPETAGIVTEQHLGLLQPGTIIVNTARAELIASGALETAALQRCLRLALDVFAREPLPVGDPVLGLEDAVLTPHQGYNTPEALDSLLRIAVDNIDGFIHRRPVHTV